MSSVRSFVIFEKDGSLDARYDEQALPSGSVVRAYISPDGVEALNPAAVGMDQRAWKALLKEGRQYVATGDWNNPIPGTE